MTTALPSADQLTGAGITEGDFKAAVQNWLLFNAGLLGADGLPATARSTLKSLCSASATLTSAYLVVAADCGKTLRCLGTWTLTLPGVAGIGDGFAIAVVNLGSGTITINGLETIDGLASMALSAGQSMIVTCNGDSWATVGRGGGAVVKPTLYQGSQTFSTAGTFTFTPPTGCSSVNATVVGGAGGGGGASDSSYGGRGGTGGTCIGPVSVTSSGITVVVGAGGAGGYRNEGGAGGTSSMGGLSATGGGGGGGGAGTAPGVLGAGGSASGGTTNTPGIAGLGGPGAINPWVPGTAGVDGSVSVSWVYLL